MINKNEKEILIIIKYLPVTLTIILSTLITYYLYSENVIRFNYELKKLEENFIASNKEIIKYQVENIIDRINYQKNQKVEMLKAQLKEQVNNAYNIANSIYLNNKNKSKEEIKKLIKDAIRPMRFYDGRGYFFIYERTGKNILHPIKPNLEEKDLWNYQDKKGTFLLQEMNRILSNQSEVFYSWYWTKPTDKKTQYEKVGFFKLLEPLDWFIGSGEYIFDFEKELKKNLINEVQDYRYSKDGYIFIIDNRDKFLSYYDKTKLGLDVKNLNNVNNTNEVLNKMKKLIVDGGGYLSYLHSDKPSASQNKIPKTSYVNGVNQWDWIVGTGFYMDDFYKKLDLKKQRLYKDNKQALEKIIIISLIATIVLLIIFVYISKVLEKKFHIYRLNIEKQIDDNIKKDNILAHQSKMASMGEMIGNIAHQWRQPLSTISTISTGLKMQKEMGIEDQKLQLEAYDNINKQVQYLSTTIDDFRSFFKPESKANEFQLKLVLEQTLNLVSTQFKSKDIDIITEINDVSLYSLKNELIQVLINILNNARDELLKKDSQRLIFINTKIEKEIVSIEILDNANGVDKSIINRIFEPYFTTKQMKQGTGIGLFMAEEIVVKHLNGTIEVENKEYKYNNSLQKGALFTVKLPLNLKYL